MRCRRPDAPPRAPAGGDRAACTRRLRVDLALYAPRRRAARGRRPAAAAARARHAPLRCACAAAAAPGCFRSSDGRFLVTGALRGPWRPGRSASDRAVRRSRSRSRSAPGRSRGGSRAGWSASRPASSSSAKAISRPASRSRARTRSRRSRASFNRSASRIEELVRSHQMLLANASHELRTPLTRINMALAMAGDDRAGAARAAQGRHRRARSADRGDPAREPARRRPRGRSAARRSICSRSPPRRPRATASSVEGASVAGARRARAAAPHGPQSDRQRAAPRRRRRARGDASDAARRLRAGRRCAITAPAFRKASASGSSSRSTASPATAETRAGSGARPLARCARSPAITAADVQCNAAEGGGGSLFAITLPPFRHPLSA